MSFQAGTLTFFHSVPESVSHQQTGLFMCCIVCVFVTCESGCLNIQYFFSPLLSCLLLSCPSGILSSTVPAGKWLFRPKHMQQPLRCSLWRAMQARFWPPRYQHQTVPSWRHLVRDPCQLHRWDGSRPDALNEMITGGGAPGFSYEQVFASSEVIKIICSHCF